MRARSISSNVNGRPATKTICSTLLANRGLGHLWSNISYESCMPDGRLSISSFISVILHDRSFLIISHKRWSHRYVRFCVSRSLFFKWSETFFLRRFSVASIATRCLMTRSISFSIFADSSLPASSILSEASSNLSNSRLIWKYGRLVSRNLRLDGEDGVRLWR